MLLNCSTILLKIWRMNKFSLYATYQLDFNIFFLLLILFLVQKWSYLTYLLPFQKVIFSAEMLLNSLFSAVGCKNYFLSCFNNESKSFQVADLEWELLLDCLSNKAMYLVWGFISTARLSLLFLLLLNYFAEYRFINFILIWHLRISFNMYTPLPPLSKILDHTD